METISTVLDAEAMAQAVIQAVSGGSTFLLTVTGGSMVPALLHRKSQVELVSAENIRKGDILLVRRKNGALILHRLVKIDGDTLTLNGDAQKWTEQVSRQQILAKVSRICRKGRWYDAGTLGDRLYCLLWGTTRPIRPALFKLYSHLK